MSEKRFTYFKVPLGFGKQAIKDNANDEVFDFTLSNVLDKLNEQQELIEELQVSDEMGWKRAKYFEKKCPKELHNKKMYIKRLEYKVQKFKEENKKLKHINDQLEERLESSGIGIALKMDCEKYE